MQLGNLVVGAVVALVVALVGRRPKVAVAVLAAVGLKLVVERVLRDRLDRRPGGPPSARAPPRSMRSCGATSPSKVTASRPAT